MPEASTQPSQQEILGLLSLLRPWSMRQHRKLRLGNDWDGGYVLPEVALACDGLLSIGVGPDVSFDRAFARRGVPVFQFDHTVAGPPPGRQRHAGFHFERRGLGPVSEGDFLSLTDMLARLRAAGVRRPALKFDIEGAEYDALAPVPAETLAAFEVIVCELHGFDQLTSRTAFQQVLRLLQQLCAAHVPVHLHGNNYGGMVHMQGVSFPATLEASWLRRDLDFFFAPLSGPMPGPHDRPNDPQQPDLVLNPF